MPATQLPDRGVVLVSGDDAQSFLQNIVTCDIDQLPPGEARLSALLTPQGKILFDFLVSHAHAGASPSPALPGYFLDCRRAILPDLLKRLGLYKLRAKVLIAEASVEGKPLAVVAMWGGRAEAADRAQSARDGRHPALGDRLIVDPAEAAAFREPVPEAYHGHRISLGIPEGGLDYSFGDAFPHDADMDDLGGVAFDKGCYIGQEVVSRMQHRGTARRRIVIAHSDAVLPPQGTPVNAGERALGTLGSSVGREGLVLVRLDRAREAMDAGVPIVAAEARLTLELPSWARFGWPTATTVADA